MQRPRECPELPLGARQLEHRAVQQLDGGGAELEPVAGRGDRGRDRVEVPDRERLGLGQRDQADGRLGDRDERALRADHEAGEVERRVAGEAVEAVAAGLAPVAGVAGRDRLAVVAQDRVDPAVERRLERAPARPARALGLRDRPEPGARAVGEHHLERVHVVDGLAVDDRLAPRGVVADHAADRRPVGRRGVRAEPEAVRASGAVEVLLHDPRPDAHAPGLGIEVRDRVHVAGGVEHDPAGADRLARQARPGAAADDGDLVAAGGDDRRGDVVGVAGEGHEQRLGRVHARVAGEQVAGVGVVADLAAQLAPQRRRDVRAPALPLPDGHRRPLSAALLPARRAVKHERRWSFS